MAVLSTQALHILLALAERDQHGYGLMQDIAEQTGGKLRLGAGTLYGAIKRLLGEGLIVEVRQTHDSRRRYYHLTALGRKTAQAEVKRMIELTEHARARGLVAKPS